MRKQNTGFFFKKSQASKFLPISSTAAFLSLYVNPTSQESTDYGITVQLCPHTQKPTHVAKLGEITGKTWVLYSELKEITGKTPVLACGYICKPWRIYLSLQVQLQKGIHYIDIGMDQTEELAELNYLLKIVNYSSPDR